MRLSLSLVFLLICRFGFTSDLYPRNEAIDIIHYRFQLALNDTTDVIAGQATITINFKKAISEFELDLVNRNSAGMGMKVGAVLLNGSVCKFEHQNDRLRIFLPASSVKGQTVQFTISYSGVPQDGLIIGRNKFGDRTFFGDNWPNRAHHWLPCVDHPSDKATCEFLVTAPEYYEVIGNGKKMEESNLPAHRKLTRWQESVQIPMKVMVIGAGRFAIEEAGRVDDIAVESWVFPQNREAGFQDYRVAVKVLDYFHHHIGSYPYEKLANVQSKTRYGGMENASNIFYAENSVTGKNQAEGLIAHEIAHQWFGNSASELDWHHVWLSEGFATYFSHLYMEASYGHDVLVEEMKQAREEVLAYYKVNPAPVIDTAVTVLMTLLNTNSYQKGGWVLHMLRHEVGDQVFWQGVQNYYQEFRNGNALTSDFQQIMEDASKKDLTQFFNQWIWTGGHPQLSGQWTFDPKRKMVIGTLSQVQPGLIFNVPVEIGLKLPDGSVQVHQVRLLSKNAEFSIPAAVKPLEVSLDPGTWLLFEGKIKAR